MAERTAKYVPSKIVVTETMDPRSYRMNSDKLLATGFTPKKSVDHAIRELIEKYKEGTIKDDKSYYNVKWMKDVILKKGKTK